MIVKELFVKLGLDVDAASFAEGNLAAEGVAHGFEWLVEKVHEGVEALKELVVGTAEARHQVGEMAIRTGVSSDAIQQLAYAASFSNVSLDELGQSLNILARHGVKNVKEEVLRLADQIHGMPADGRRAELAMEKFGRAGGRMVPILARGREELEELFAEAVVASPEAIEASTHFVETLKKIQVTSRSLWKAAATPLIEALNPILDQLRAWQVENAALIRQKVKEWATLLGEALTKTWRAVVKLRAALIALRGTFEELAKFLLFVAGTVLVANIGQLITLARLWWATGEAARVAGWKAFAAWVKAGLPIAIILAGLFFIYEALVDLYYAFTGGESVFKDFWDSIMDSDAIFALTQWFKGVKGWFSSVVDSWKAAISEFFGWVVPKLKSIPGVSWVMSKLGSGSGSSSGTTAGSTPPSTPSAGYQPDFSPEALFGGGASPAASASVNQSTVNRPLIYQPQLSIQQSITAAPGQSPKDVARASTQAQDEALARTFREAHEAVQR